MLRPMHAYFSHNTVTRLDISQRGVLAAGYGRKVQLWQGALREKAQSPYMTHNLAAGALQDFRFCPFEDVLGIGHAGGISTMLVPGAAGRGARCVQHVCALLHRRWPGPIAGAGAHWLAYLTAAPARNLRPSIGSHAGHVVCGQWACCRATEQSNGSRRASSWLTVHPDP